MFIIFSKPLQCWPQHCLQCVYKVNNIINNIVYNARNIVYNANNIVKNVVYNVNNIVHNDNNIIYNIVYYILQCKNFCFVIVTMWKCDFGNVVFIVHCHCSLFIVIVNLQCCYNIVGVLVLRWILEHFRVDIVLNHFAGLLFALDYLQFR